MQKHQQQLTELRKKSRSSLFQERRVQQDQLTKLRIAVSLQKEKNVSQIKLLRKSIARLETVLHEETNA